jgi:nuclear pore complex protein Nup205
VNKYYFLTRALICSCLTVILHALDKLARPEVNAGLHELGFKLLYELCVDPITCGPMVDLLRNGKYDFLPKVCFACLW